MLIFGMKAPRQGAEMEQLKDMCRHIGLRFIELPEGMACPEQSGQEEVQLVPRGRALYLSEAEPDVMEKQLDRMEEGSLVVLLPRTEDSLPAFSLWVNGWLNRQSSAGEMWDVYDKDRNLTGRLHPRGERLGGEDYHLVVHVWLKNSRGEFLLTRRSPNKGYGGMWESPGGSAQAGDDSLTACVREIKEETGLRLEPARGRIVKSYREDHFFCDVWLFRQDFAIEDVVLQEGETCDCMYASPEQIRKLHSEGRFVPFQFLDEVLAAE